MDPKNGQQNGSVTENVNANMKFVSLGGMICNNSPLLTPPHIIRKKEDNLVD